MKARLLGLAALAIPGLHSVAAAADGIDSSPPTQSVDATFSGTAASAVSLSGGTPAGRQSAASAGVSWTERRPWTGGGFFYGWGLQADTSSFSSNTAVQIRHLQDLAANLSLEYFEGSEQVASLVLRPGFYFETHPDASCWDIPVELESGIPLAKNIDGVLGGTDGRLFHRPVPIVGIIWTLSERFRIEAVYPEPALVWIVRKGMEARLAGELTGYGYKTDAHPMRTRVDYYAYRVGAQFSYDCNPRTRIAAAAGCEIEREFDFYQLHRRYEAKPAPYAEVTLTFH